MRKANVYVHGIKAGILEEIEKNKSYTFKYLDEYNSEPVSLTMPLNKRLYIYNTFPSFFDGLLPEGFLLEGLLRINKIDKNDYFGQLLKVGLDMVGSVTVEKYNE
ncbi:MAG: HipA N-terminal domain-containing protein [Cyanobacteriota bacterium]